MEMSENIYANTETIADNRYVFGDSDRSYEEFYANDKTLKTQSEESFKDPKNPVSVIKTAGSRNYRMAALCLGLLFVILSVAIITLSVKLTAKRDQLQTSYNDMTVERDQLQTSYNSITAKRDQLQTSYNSITAERDQLQTSYNSITAERDQLQTSYNSITAERDQLQTSYNSITAERDQLQISYNSITAEKDQLQTSYNSITAERDQLQNQIKQVTDEKKILQTSYNDSVNQREQLQQKNCGLLKRIADREYFRVGDRVRVKSKIGTPKYNWGDASHKSVGPVKEVDGEHMVVNFPEHSGWKAAASEMELVISCD